MVDKDNNTHVGPDAMYIPLHNRTASAYARVAVETSVSTADPHELINLLFKGLLDTLALAKRAIESRDIAAKGKFLAKAIRLIDEGLQSSLSPEGGDLKNNLSALYDYCIARLTQANIKSDSAAIDEVRRLIEPLAEGWSSIRNQAAEGIDHVER